MIEQKDEIKYLQVELEAALNDRQEENEATLEARARTTETIGLIRQAVKVNTRDALFRACYKLCIFLENFGKYSRCRTDTSFIIFNKERLDLSIHLKKKIMIMVMMMALIIYSFCFAPLQNLIIET